MYKFGKLLAVFGILGASLWLQSCQLDGDDFSPVHTPPVEELPSDPAVGALLPLGDVEAIEAIDPGPGYILAGQTGERFVVDDFGSTGYLIDAREGGNYWTYVIDSSTQTQFVVGASSSGSSYYSYTGVNIGMQGGLELSGVMVQDSVWRCETWSVDSSLNVITTYNSLSNFHCSSNNPTYVSLESRPKPLAYNQGRRIDQNMLWGLQSGIFYLGTWSYLSQSTSLGYRETISQITYSFWNEMAPHYLAFRWWSQGRYRYGYVHVAAMSSAAIVYRIAYER